MQCFYQHLCLVDSECSEIPHCGKLQNVEQNARLRLAFCSTTRRVTPKVVQRCFGFASHFVQRFVRLHPQLCKDASATPRTSHNCGFAKLQKKFLRYAQFFLKLRKPNESLWAILTTKKIMTEETFIRKGFFPKELPPPFNTDSLANSVVDILPQLDTTLDLVKDETKTKNGVTTLERKYKQQPKSKLIPYSVPKIQTHRRLLAIPNPIHQIRLCNTIVSNWIDITQHTEQSAISLTRLTEDTTGKKVFQEMSFEEITEQKILRSSGAKYLLRLDISRFYPSIYTHSIPWALHTKTTSKAQKTNRNLLGNAIDQDLRRLQDDQTMGIPIGSETSRVISEIIATSIELNVSQNLNGIRLIDDYHLYFKSMSDLEKCISDFNKSMKDYELALNPSKQRIVELPEIYENKWVWEVKSFRFRNKVSEQKSDLISYFNLAFDNSKKYRDDYVMRFAIRGLKYVVINTANFYLLEELLLKSLFYEPKTIDFISEIFLSYRDKGYNINLPKLTDRLNEFLIYHINLENTFEISWCLWLMTKLRISLNSNLANSLSQVENSVIALIALDMRESNLISSGLDTTLWQSILNDKSNLYSENWLLVYESVKKGWLSFSSTDWINSDVFFNFIRTKNVDFYDTTKGLDLSNVAVSNFETSVE